MEGWEDKYTINSPYKAMLLCDLLRKTKVNGDFKKILLFTEEGHENHCPFLNYEWVFVRISG